MKTIKIFFLIIAVAAGAAQAQQISLAEPDNVYQTGEAITIQYSGAIPGSQILLYKNLAMLPLVEGADLTQADGTYIIPATLQPSIYTARLVEADSTVVSELSFTVANEVLPTTGKKIFVIGDPHVFNPDLIEVDGSAYVESVMKGDRKLTPESYEIFLAVLDSVRAVKPDLLVIPGDLTKEGERVGHELVAARLQEIQEEGIPVLVIPGNHDMENALARRYYEKSSVQEPTVTIEKFREIYQNFGWGEGSVFDPTSLTYACEPIEGLCFIGIDDCKTYSRGYKTYGEAEYGCISQATLDWVTDRADEARENGKVVVAAIHHQLLRHYVGQDDFMDTAALDHGDSIARIFLDHGIRVVLTGHMHIPSISTIWNAERTDSLVEISSASTVSYPSQFRILALDDSLTRMRVTTHEMHTTETIDDVQYLAQEKIRNTLKSTIRKLVDKFHLKFIKILNEYASDPILSIVINDVPTSVDSLTNIAYTAFGPLGEKIILTHSEGSENKKRTDALIDEFYASCNKCCDLVFDHQDADTRAFLSIILTSQFESRGIIETLRSMLTDTAYMGEADEAQTDDLFCTIRLRPTDEEMAIHGLTANDTTVPTVIYNLSGQRIAMPEACLPRGIYIVVRGGEARKVMIQ